MYVDEVESCCTAKIINSFPSPEDTWLKQPTIEEIKKELLVLKKEGNAICIAFLTDKQKESIKMLKEVGFTCTRAVSKTHHPENKLYLLHIKLDTWKGK